MSKPIEPDVVKPGIPDLSGVGPSMCGTSPRPRVESVYGTPKIFGVEFENIRRTGVRLYVSKSLAYWREKRRRKL